MIRVLIVIQLVVSVVAVLWLVLFGWIADQLSRPADRSDSSAAQNGEGPPVLCGGAKDEV